VLPTWECPGSAERIDPLELTTRKQSGIIVSRAVLCRFGGILEGARAGKHPAVVLGLPFSPPAGGVLTLSCDSTSFDQLKTFGDQVCPRQTLLSYIAALGAVFSVSSVLEALFHSQYRLMSHAHVLSGQVTGMEVWGYVCLFSFTSALSEERNSFIPSAQSNQTNTGGHEHMRHSLSRTAKGPA